MTIPHVYEIHYSNNYLNFIIDGSSVYSLTTGYSQWSQTMNLYAFASNVCSDNSGGGYILAIRSLNISRLGPLHTQNRSYFRSTTTTGIVLKYSCGLVNSLIFSNISNNSVISLYDGTDTSGVLLYTTGALASNTHPISVNFSHGIPFNTALCLVIGTASSNVLVEYE
jgi:hypothetical protein